MKQPDYPFPKAILFDWDNTLVDSFPVIYKAVTVMWKHFGLPVLSFEEYRKNLGLSLRDTFPDLFGDRWEEARDIYLEAFQKYHLEELTPFPDAFGMLEYARKTVGRLGVVSNKTGFILRREVACLGWEGLFDAVVGATDAAHDKPAADPVIRALEGSGISMEDGRAGAPVWFVGDGDADILCARNTGCLPVRIADENRDGSDVLTLKNCSELLSVLYSYAGTE
ncbi:MAG: HAD family hydrolase [Alphaproteobacteria bacterium]